MFLAGPSIRAMDDRSPYGSFWFEPTSVRTSSGVRVSSETAMRLSSVYACVRVLAETFAVLPFCLTEKVGGVSKPVKDHWLVRLMKRPNQWQNGFEWREMMMGHLALRGNAYNRVQMNGRGNITALIPIHPDRVRPEVLQNGDYRYRVMRPGEADEILTRADLWHLRGLSSDGITGLSPIEVARETIGLGISAQEYGARFFQNDARPGGGWIEYAGQFKDREARKTFRDTWQEMQAGGNRHKTAVLEMGMKYHELAIKNNDAQFLETRQFQVTDIARIFRMPPHLIGDLTRSTNNNIEQQSLEFVTFTMTPWAERWEASIENDLLLDSEDLDVEFDFANLLRGDAAARAEFYSSGITNGWLTRNEARMKESLNPLDGLNEPLVPMNMQTQDQHERGEGEPPGEPDDDSEDMPADTEEEPEDAAPAPNARLAALAASAAQRVARREAAVVSRAVQARQDVGKVYEDHATFVSEVLGVPMQAAQEYCAHRLQLFKADVELTDFEDMACSALERLAIKGSTT